MAALLPTHFSVFGWKVAHVICPDGYTFIAEPSKAGPRSEGPNLTLHTKGRLHCVCLTDSEPVVSPRLAGTSTLSLLPIRVGKFKFTAEGECQWWCFSRLENDMSLPNAKPVVIPEGETRTFDIGTRLFLCEGSAVVNGESVVGPLSLQSTENPIGLTAKSVVYGFLFEDWA